MTEAEVTRRARSGGSTPQTFYAELDAMFEPLPRREDSTRAA
jgi:hypothetical protein